MQSAATPTDDQGWLSPKAVGEVRRLADAMLPGSPMRMAVSSASLALSLVFVPLLPVVLCMLTDTVADWVTVRAMRRFVRRPTRFLYRVIFTGTVIASVAYVMPATLLLLHPDPMTKVFALAYYFAILLHISLVLSAHLRLALVVLGAVSVPVLLANTVFWLNEDGWVYMAMSNIALIGLTLYPLSMIVTQNRVQTAYAAAREDALRANAQKTRFMAKMSHEMRTPLNGILAISELLQDTDTPGALAPRLTLLNRSARDLCEIVDDLLDLSAIEAGELKLPTEIASPETVLRETVAIFCEVATDKGLALHVTVDPLIPSWAEFSPLRLRQVVRNLVSNAVKYTERGRISIDLRRGAGPMLVLTVADTGPGIPEELQEQVLMPFVQLEDGTARRHGGVGLGLPITRELSDRMGGALALNCPPGGGTVFTMSFVAPMRPAPGEVAVAHTEKSAAPTETPLHILVVDDLATNRIVAGLLLRDAGHDVTEAEDCASALAALAEGGIDGVLLDMRMPELDGTAVLTRIRAEPALWAGLPVVAMTADAAEQDRARILAEGFDGYLAKPIDSTRLEEALSQIRAIRLARTGLMQGMPKDWAAGAAG